MCSKKTTWRLPTFFLCIYGLVYLGTSDFFCTSICVIMYFCTCVCVYYVHIIHIVNIVHIEHCGHSLHSLHIVHIVNIVHIDFYQDGFLELP